MELKCIAMGLQVLMHTLSLQCLAVRLVKVGFLLRLLWDTLYLEAQKGLKIHRKKKKKKIGKCCKSLGTIAVNPIWTLCFCVSQLIIDSCGLHTLVM